jgi:hypothetical protein
MESHVKVDKCEKCNKRFHKIPIVEQPVLLVVQVLPPASIAPLVSINNTIIKNECEYCKKVLSRIDNLIRHEKICKKKKRLDEIVILKEKIIELESTIQDMKKIE